MPTTPVYALPYPVESDTADVPRDMQALATRLEAVLPTASVGVPTGGGIDWFTSVAPAGFLLCDGSAVSRTTFAALFGVIGTIWGPGDGATTFNLPDTRGRVCVGLASGGHADVATLAANDGAALANRRPRHPHSSALTASHNLSLPDHGHVHNLSLPDHSHNIGLWIEANAAGNYPKSNASNVGYGRTATSNGVNSTPAINGSVNSISSVPAINGGVSLGGTIGPAGANPDAPSYVVVAKAIKS